MDHHRSRVLQGAGTPRFDFEMIRLLLACAASTPGDDVHKAEAIRYLKPYFLVLSPELQEEVRSQPGAGLLIDRY